MSSFEAIPHSGLMAAIEERISRPPRAEATARDAARGSDDGRRGQRRDTGTPQGGVLSPCLANVYLHRLDRQWADRGTGVLVRYADDLLALCHNRQEAERALAALRRSWPSWVLSSSRPRRGSCTLEGGRAWTFSGFHHRGCAATASGIAASSPAGPHGRRCSAPATGSVRSRTELGPAGSTLRRSCRTSTRSPARMGGLLPDYGNSGRTFEQDQPLRGGPPHAVRGRSSPHQQAESGDTAWKGMSSTRPARPPGLINLNGTIVAPRPNRRGAGTNIIPTRRSGTGHLPLTRP